MSTPAQPPAGRPRKNASFASFIPKKSSLDRPPTSVSLSSLSPHQDLMSQSEPATRPGSALSAGLAHSGSRHATTRSVSLLLTPRDPWSAGSNKSSGGRRSTALSGPYVSDSVNLRARSISPRPSTASQPDTPVTSEPQTPAPQVEEIIHAIEELDEASDKILRVKEVVKDESETIEEIRLAGLGAKAFKRRRKNSKVRARGSPYIASSPNLESLVDQVERLRLEDRSPVRRRSRSDSRRMSRDSGASSDRTTRGGSRRNSCSGSGAGAGARRESVAQRVARMRNEQDIRGQVSTQNVVARPILSRREQKLHEKLRQLAVRHATKDEVKQRIKQAAHLTAAVDNARNNANIPIIVRRPSDDTVTKIVPF